MFSTMFAMGIFSFVMSFSPGPVNLISMSIGINQGFKKALPFVSGATIGFTLLLFFIGLGLGKITVQFPIILNIFSFLGAAFIMYVGYKMSSSSATLELEEDQLPSFWDGALLQCLNPKAWTACLAGVAAFEVTDEFSRLALFTIIYFSICYIGIGSWAFIGGKILIRLNSPSGTQVIEKMR